MDTLFFTLLGIGIVSAFIGTLAGGGGLITLPAMMLVGVPIQIGIATNKFSSGVAALTSIFYLLKNKQLRMKTIIVNVCIAFTGGICGALITSHITEQTMNIVALILLIFAFIVTLKNKQWVSSALGQAKTSTIVSNAVPFFIAAYDGGFGPGSSTFGILHYMNQKNTYMKAVQLTRVLIFGSCCGAFIVFYQTGFVQWNYAIAMAVGSAIGSQIGLLALPRVPLRVAKSLLITIIFLLIGQVVWDCIKGF
ncbi:sulfite exporter TauE/SafE family protein [Ectobacillus polymachus]|uniref:sulfite exporter TauE/SafE family protein n=1 Tax=Ectobacillus polymachus TaxID=1508806 RepID=UPI003A86D007